MWDAGTLTAIGAGLVSLGGVIGVAGKAAVDAVIRLRKSRLDNNMEVRKHDDAQAKEAYEAASVVHEQLRIQFEARIKALEDANGRTHEELKATRAELSQARAEHTNCLVAQESLRGELKALQIHVDRLWKHDEANREHAKALKSELETTVKHLKSDSGAFKVGEELDAAKAEYEAKLKGKAKPPT